MFGPIFVFDQKILFCFSNKNFSTQIFFSATNFYPNIFVTDKIAARTLTNRGQFYACFVTIATKGVIQRAHFKMSVVSSSIPPMNGQRLLYFSYSYILDKQTICRRTFCTKIREINTYKK